MKKFFVLWSSQAASMFGSTIVGFTLAWYLARETGSATILSTAMLVNILPGVALGPFIGPFIDRWSRKQIMIYSDLIIALLTLLLVVLFHTGSIQIWHIYVIMAGRSIGASFQGPALSASVPMIVPEKQLVRANGLNMTLRGANNIVSPLAGAFLIEALDMQWVLSVDIITAVIAVACLIPLAIPQPPRSVLVARPGYFTDLKQGFRYVTAWRGLLYLVVLFAILQFLSAPANALTPLFVTEYFGGDVLKLGWLQTAAGVGVIAGGLIMGVWGGFKRRIVTTLASIMLQAVSVFIFGFTTEGLFLLAVSMRLVSGLCSAMLNAPLGAIMQSAVARDMQGRVFALQNSLIGITMPLSLAIAGPVADAVELRSIWYVSAAAIFIVTGFAFFSRDLMNIDDNKVKEKPGEETSPPVPKLENGS
jgi:DHA3 family macrolide efflux protein-like MFS transporter